MKKLFAMVLALVMVLSAVAALAEEAEGNWVAIENMNLMMWIPADMQQAEIGEEEAAMGFTALYVNADNTARVGTMYIEANGTAPADAVAAIPGATAVTEVEINGLPGLGFDVKTEESEASCVAFATEKGNIVVVLCGPANDDSPFLAVIGQIFASIQEIPEE